MKEIHIRDLHTDLGEQIDATEGMESLLEIRLEMATIREKSARQVFEHVAENYKNAAEELESATNKRVYWEGQLQKSRDRNSPTTTTTSHTFVVNSNGMSPETIGQLIQEAGEKAFEEDILVNADPGEPKPRSKRAEVIEQLLMDADREGGEAYRTGGYIDLADYLAEGLAKAEEDTE